MQVEAIVEGFTSMKNGLDSEKKSYATHLERTRKTN
jgi:hypothetical protein